MFTINNFNFNTEASREKKTGEEVYFQGSKKNELNEFKMYLKNIATDPEKDTYRKELITKIMAYTTAGVDTSRLYPEIVIASATKDIVEKKLIFMYLSIYSNANENFARMAINTFMKDTSSPDPNVRSLAIRHLSNLRFKGRDQYVFPILKAGLSDFSPLVKKSCVMGITKLIVERNRGVEQPERDEQILNTFYELIRDSDTYLVCTVIEAINEIEPEGIAMSKKLANYLLTNINSFGEYQLPTILHYLDLYQPKNEEDIMNVLKILHPKMKSSILSVALGVGKIFLKILKIRPDLEKQIMQQIKNSLMSFLNHDVPEIEFAALKHIQYLIDSLKTQIFVPDIRKFLLGGEEPTYVKIMKIRILQHCIRRGNLADIINEFAEYLLDEMLCQETVNALSKTLLITDQNDSKFIIKTIIKVVQSSSNDFLCNYVLPVIRNYLRKFPNDFKMFANIFYQLVKNAHQDEARCAMIEIIGDYGDQIEDAVELVAWTDSNLSNALKISLLRANLKLFFKRPEEMINVIGHLFKNILSNDDTHLQIKDYAAFLYRGLQLDLNDFQKLFLECRKQAPIIVSASPELQFNSLQIIYKAAQQKWMIEKTKFIEVAEQIYYDPNQTTVNEDAEEIEREQIWKKRKMGINVDSKFKMLEAENFDITFTMNTQQFQNAWENYEIGSSITRMISNLEQLSEDNLQELFKAWNVSVMASAETEEEIKLYLFCKVIEVGGDLGVACMQFCVLKLAETMTLLIKCDNQELAGFISRYIEEFLKLNEII